MEPNIVRFDSLEIENGFTYLAGSSVTELLNSFSTGIRFIEAQLKFDKNGIFLNGKSIDEQGKSGQTRFVVRGTFSYEDNLMSSASVTQLGSTSSGIGSGGPYSEFWFGNVLQLPSPLNISNPRDTSSWATSLMSVYQDEFEIASYEANFFESNSNSIRESGTGLDGLLSFFETSNFDDLIKPENEQDVSSSFIRSSIGRLYTAAFGRVPDEGGLQFWINVVNDPLVNYKDVSQNFVDSPEFSTIALPNSSSDVFATALYQNVLGRAPDSPGLSYWTNQLNSGLQDRADVLIGFANSAENVALYETLV